MGITGKLNIELLTTIGALCMALAVIAIRLQASKKPTSARKIILPPLGMSTGFLMFVVPWTRIPWSFAVGAFLVGVILSYPLIATSQMDMMDGEVYLKRSKGFIAILLVLMVLRVALHGYVERYITYPQTGAVLFILAFGMLLPWRVAMFVKFRQLQRGD